MLLRTAALAVALSLSGQERRILDKEAAMGAMLARDFKQEATMLESTAFNKFIERAGLQLFAQLGPNQPKYTFGLIATAGLGRNLLHEAVSFPGGYIFIPANLVVAAADEEEFVRIIAHAMAHIAGQRIQIGQLGSVPIIFMGGRFGLGPDDEMTPIGMRKAMHDREVAADELAAQMVAGLSGGPFMAPDDFSKMQAEVRSMVAERKPRPPSLLNPH
ncbi:MAG: hypothetical protein M3Y27_25375 [Acidobacteriota bacterium]|nr:hypothetical protein [Acidobacteriota bacterium]